MKILIAEDDAVTSALLRSFMTRWEYDAIMVADGLAAWEEVSKNPEIGIVLADWMMPGLEGPALCEKIHNEIKDRYIYFMLITQRTTSEDLAKGFSQGADDYILKPVDSKVLKGRLTAAVRISRLQNDLIREQAKLKNQQNELTTLFRQKSSILASIAAFCIVIDTNDLILTFNRQAEELFHKSSDKVLNQSLLRIGIDWDWLTVLSAISDSRETGQTTHLQEIPYRIAEGNLRYLDIAISPVTTEESTLREIILLGTDVTERRNLIGQLSQAQKLEAIGQLASGIAHEINTPMQYVGDNTRFAKEGFQAMRTMLDTYRQTIATGACSFDELKSMTNAMWEEKLLDYLLKEVPVAIEQTLEGVQRVAHIVRAMKEFTHPGTKEAISLDLNHALENAATVSRNEWRYVADIEWKLDPQLPLVECYPNELNQVFLNLIVNAAHAVGDVVKMKKIEKGTICITTITREHSVEVSIRDSGTGIPERLKKKIFDPLFTTKEIGRGTGQGLTIVYNVITLLHQGSINFETEEGKGTEFVVSIPLKQKRSHGQQSIVC